MNNIIERPCLPIIQVHVYMVNQNCVLKCHLSRVKLPAELFNGIAKHFVDYKVKRDLIIRMYLLFTL